VTAFGDDILAGVLDVISEVGISGIFTVPADEYDVAEGDASGSVEGPFTITCSPPLAYSDAYLANSTARAGDVRLFVRGADAEAAGYTPSKADVVNFGAGDWRVVVVTIHQPDERVAAYELQLRQ
jgi:hypothetical protein